MECLAAFRIKKKKKKKKKAKVVMAVRGGNWHEHDGLLRGMCCVHVMYIEHYLV
jgi:hypothetical protein